MTIKLELSIKDAAKLKRILNKYHISNLPGIDSLIDKAYAKTLDDILLEKINVAKIDEYTDELCYGIRQWKN